MEFTIIGLGYVGLVNAVYLASLGHQVIGFDIDKNKISLLKQGVSTLEEPSIQQMLTESYMNIRFTSNHKDAIRNAKNIFICVDTPHEKDGCVNLKNYYAALDMIVQDSTCEQTIIIRSTVPVGTNKASKKYLEDRCGHKFIVIFFPEFLRQGNAVEDLIQPYRLVIGVNGSHALDVAKKVAQSALIKKATVMITTPENAELIKYASDCFLAMKTSYINDIAKFCELVNADVEKVAKGMALDPRIGNSFLDAGIGYGGVCFPKNSFGLYSINGNTFHEMSLIRSTSHINESMVSFFLEKIYKRFRNVANLRCAVLGVAVKGDTEEIRNSQAIPIVKELLDKGVHINVYDPLALDNFASFFNRYSHIKYSDYAYEALKNADFCIILNDAKEFKELKANDFISYMRKAIIFDGRNLFKVEDMAGTEYYSIGRSPLKKINKGKK